MSLRPPRGTEGGARFCGDGAAEPRGGESPSGGVRRPQGGGACAHKAAPPATPVCACTSAGTCAGTCLRAEVRRAREMRAACTTRRRGTPRAVRRPTCASRARRCLCIHRAHMRSVALLCWRRAAPPRLIPVRGVRLRATWGEETACGTVLRDACGHVALGLASGRLARRRGIICARRAGPRPPPAVAP